jgi:hypothetical protein
MNLIFKKEFELLTCEFLELERYRDRFDDFDSLYIN